MEPLSAAQEALQLFHLLSFRIQLVTFPGAAFTFYSVRFFSRFLALICFISCHFFYRTVHIPHLNPADLSISGGRCQRNRSAAFSSTVMRRLPPDLTRTAVYTLFCTTSSCYDSRLLEKIVAESCHLLFGCYHFPSFFCCCF